MIDADSLWLLTTLAELRRDASWLGGVEARLHALAESFGQSGEWLIRLALAATLGGIIGAEREMRGHAAGFRTFMLVCAGASLVMIVSISFAYGDWTEAAIYPVTDRLQVDPGRIAYGVMTGVGFLGAGTIVHQRNRVQGLTTAAGIWAVAALGLAVGFGLYIVSLGATITLLLTLLALSPIRRQFPTLQTRRLKIRLANSADQIDAVRRLVGEYCPRVSEIGFRRDRRGERATIDLRVRFVRAEQLETLRRRLMSSDGFELLEIRP